LHFQDVVCRLQGKVHDAINNVSFARDDSFKNALGLWITWETGPLNIGDRPVGPNRSRRYERIVT